MVAEAADAAKKSAVLVRRIIQKVRVATPEKFETLEKELAAALEEHGDSLGDQLAKVQEEGEKGLEVARKRIEQVKNQRKKEEEKAQRPKELLKELSGTWEALETKTAELVEQESSSDLEAMGKLVEELQAELTNFTKATLAFNAKNGAELKAASATMPTIATEHKEVNAKLVAKKKEAETALIKARATIKKAADEKAKEEQDAKAKVLKEQLDSAKPEIEEQIKEVEDLIDQADKDIQTAESIVYPFSRGRQLRNTEAEILATCEEVESAISVAQSMVDTAAEKKPNLADDDFDEAVRKQLEAFLTEKAKKASLRIARCQARLRRCRQLVKTTKADISKGKIDTLVKEMKEKLLTDIQAATDLSSLDEPLKVAEEKVLPFVKLLAGKITQEKEAEMAEPLDEATKAVEHIKESVAVVRDGLCPIDDDVDEEVKKELRKVVANETKATTTKLDQIDKRIQRAESIITRFNAEIKKLKIAEEIEALKPDLLAKVREGSSVGAISTLEDLIATAESLVLPFARGCKADPSEFESLANAAAEAVEKAQAAVPDAQGEFCPIDESLDEDIKKALLAFIAPEIKKPKIRVGQLCRRLRRASQLVKSFRQDIAKEGDNKIAKIKAKAVKFVRDLREKESLTSEDLFKKFSPADGSIDDAGFKKFFQDAGSDIAVEDLAEVFTSLLSEDSTQLKEDDIKRSFCPYLKVIGSTVLTDGLPIGTSKALKQLKVGQILELLEGPKAEAEGSKVKRARVKTLVGGAEGWATMVGSAGTTFLKECPAPAAKEKSAN
mmetsp:Transcript_29853/g.48160  ORF Transcript_29853/g.48160 Transcript_29853/m.48160 type:complete len:784 (-) Transcript_29853:104-2455(-)